MKIDRVIGGEAEAGRVVVEARMRRIPSKLSLASTGIKNVEEFGGATAYQASTSVVVFPRRSRMAEIGTAAIPSSGPKKRVYSMPTTAKSSLPSLLMSIRRSNSFSAGEDHGRHVLIAKMRHRSLGRGPRRSTPGERRTPPPARQASPGSRSDRTGPRRTRPRCPCGRPCSSCAPSSA